MSWYDDIRSLLAPDPNREYSALLPLSRAKDSNVVGGDQQFALPGAVREGLLGIVDLARGTETGKLTGPALESLLGGMVGGGMTAPRGAIGSGPIRAYHGSPHSFEKFDPAKIGTGEGAQAYGHGLYFAEREGVARSYRDHLANTIDPRDAVNDFIARNRGWLGRNPGETPEAYVKAELPFFHDANVAALADNPEAIGHIATILSDKGEGGGISNAAMRAYKALDKMLPPPSKGHMYEVDIHADPARFIDFDKPLSQQTPEVQRALAPYTRAVTEDWKVNPTLGAPTHTGQVIAGAPDPVAMSKALAEGGIPGIRYLDQGSRSAGQGSSNYVVFPTRKEIIEILRKYGMAIPSPVAPPGAVPPSGLLDREGGA